LVGFLHCALKPRWHRFGQFLNDFLDDLFDNFLDKNLYDFHNDS